MAMLLFSEGNSVFLVSKIKWYEIQNKQTFTPVYFCCTH